MLYKIEKIGRLYLPVNIHAHTTANNPFEGLTFKTLHEANNYLGQLKEGEFVKEWINLKLFMDNGDTKKVRYYHAIYELGGYIRSELVKDIYEAYNETYWYAWVCAD